MLSRLPLLTAVLAATSMTAFAQFSVSGTGGLIPATGTGGGGDAITMLPTAFNSFPLNTPVPANATGFTSLQLTGLTHSWVGDVHIVLWNPGMTTGYNIICRLGAVTGAGDGFSCNFGGNYRILPAAPPPALMWPLVNPGGAVNLASGDYPQYNGLSWISGSSNVFNLDLAAIPATPGIWTLICYDGFAADAGTLTTWTLNGTTPVIPPVGPTKVCFGDGTGTACPCGNSGAATNGCGNSASPGGASLTGTGVPSITADTLVLTNTGAPTNSPCLYAQGSASINGGLGAVLNDGLGCVGGTVIRLGTKISVAGTSSYPSGSQAISTRGANAPGDTRFYQAIFRDVAPYCTAAPANQSNSVQVTWGT